MGNGTSYPPPPPRVACLEGWQPIAAASRWGLRGLRVQGLQDTTALREEPILYTVRPAMFDPVRRFFKEGMIYDIDLPSFEYLILSYSSIALILILTPEARNLDFDNPYACHIVLRHSYMLMLEINHMTESY